MTKTMGNKMVKIISPVNENLYRTRYIFLKKIKKQADPAITITGIVIAIDFGR